MQDDRLIVTFLITAILPIAWLIADFRSTPLARRILGMVALLWSFGIAASIGIMQNFNANSYFGGASKDLLEASVQQLRAGKTASVIREWSLANEKFHPTYE